MKRNKIIYNRWLRTLFLSFALLIGGGWMAWGQETETRPEIRLIRNEVENSKVHTEEKIIYVNPDKGRVLSIPELNNNTRGANDNTYNWFVHWYVLNSNQNQTGEIKHHSFTLTETKSGMRGGYIGVKNANNAYVTHDYFVTETTNKGLLWSNRLKEAKVPLKKTNGTLGDDDSYAYGLGIDASSIAYTLPTNYASGDIVYCDVSIYQDGEYNNDSKEYKEPTLLKRYKYVIKKAEDCPSYQGESETFDFDFPDKATSINLSMPYAPDNYFWQQDGTVHQGGKFVYRINNKDNFKEFHLVTKSGSLDLQQNQKIKIEDLDLNQVNTVEVKAISSTQENELSEVIAIFKFRPIENAEFKLEDQLTKGDSDDRWPRGNPRKYRQIGIVDFDQKKEGETLPTEIVAGDNMSEDPVGTVSTATTSYGFIRKNGKSLTNSSKCYTTSPGMYGLFRSANAEVSKTGKYASTVTGINREYKWIPPYIESSSSHQHNPQIYQNAILYDRTYEVTKKTSTEQYGYFYYIDATDEPGTLVEIPIDGEICGNTELTVTGWVADMTRSCNSGTNKAKPLAPNLNIIFKGINTKNEEVELHRFTTGDALTNYENLTSHHNSSATLANTYLMKWQQFHYKFMVSEEKIQGCKEFRLEVQNNEPHTDGADYAIDDIRIFKTIPDVQVVQSGDPCDEKIKTVKFKTNYDMLLRNFGLTAGEPVNLEYATPMTYEEYNNLPDTHLLKKYFENKSEADIKGALQYFTKVYYAIYKAEYDEVSGEWKPVGNPIQIAYNGQEKSNYRVSYVSTRIEDMVWTDESSSSSSYGTDNTFITSTNVSINGEVEANEIYVARVSETPIDGECETCSFYNWFTLEGVGDRIVVTKGDQTVKLEDITSGGPYTVTGTLRCELPDGTQISITDPVFDWYLGTWDEFVKPGTIQVNGKSYSIMEALRAAFHELDNPDASTIETELKKLGEYGNSSSTGKLVLGKSSFEFSLPTGKNMQWGVMFPRANQKDLPENAVICPDPHEFLLGGTPPTIEPGDPDVPDPEDPDPDDPEDPDPKDPEDPDDPKPQPDEDPFVGSHVRSVRVGLVQIQDMQAYDGTLRIPIHVRTSLENEKFAKDINSTDIIVYKTSDPLWDFKVTSQKVVATLDDLIDNNSKANWSTNYFKIKFAEEAVNGFREGFWYMVGIPYKVVDKETNADKDYGKLVFMLTLKIVPEYVTWVGSETGMHNWNNDGLKHWRRSTNSELYMGNDSETTGAQVNGTHKEAYTPMRFTKVTILGNKDGKAPYAAYPHLYGLSKQTSGYILDMTPTAMDNTIGAATKNIEYDLLADPDYEKELFGNDKNPDKSTTGTDHNYSCVRFYGNTCDEIYIKPESEILHTEFLTYNKAHVDYEMSPNRWYMLASPLKGVVSGDMYLPTGTGNVGKYARQETPAFENITYDNTNYTRWKPAVYMRGWDKAKATVIRPDGSTTSVNYGISGSWSNLYNDVDVPFTPGTGFSIGTKTDGTVTGDKVLFRLPKADTEYEYYGSGNGSGNKTTLKNREGNGRFIISPDERGNNVVDKVLVPQNKDVPTGGMFGNPFMSHLDMMKFFEGKGKNTYYILTKDGTNSNIVKKEYSISTDDSDPKYVAPLQSFIVEGLESIEFTTNMIAKAPEVKQAGLRSATTAPAEEPLPQLRITVTRDGVRNTAVVAGLVTASDSYVEGEDAALLINEEVAAPQVYTLAGNQMTAINVTPDLNEIPLGIYGKDANPVELSFKVSGAMKNVKLVDKQTGKHYDVSDGLTLTVPGNTSGRYFLNGSIATSNEIIAQGRIIFYNSAPGRIDISSVDPLSEVTVYDIAGRALRTLRNLNTPTASVDHLAPGIYVVRAESGSQTVSEKIEVK